MDFKELIHLISQAQELQRADRNGGYLEKLSELLNLNNEKLRVYKVEVDKLINVIKYCETEKLKGGRII